ncbi:nucleotide pyrophosphohydrolase, putative [Babesia ovata]|uniref:Nucleotide pyrophosphohydrolase, putative n=1 Tax=Babesia ovata TaxID=189622 RepID=A0A2H6KFL8_9APIC|nr:nucleotide pyrophosphohydrolase, putative [Babesia ovata]GBE61785.1 nucleotide pyrophosphohydrolase, putative [Babesia ovata]
MPPSSAESRIAFFVALDFSVHVLIDLVFQLLKLILDLDEAIDIVTFIPFCSTFFKAMLFQLTQLVGDLSVQRPSKPFKLTGDLGDALADGIGLVVQYALLTLKFIFDFREAFFTFTFNGPCFSCT